MRSCSTCWAPSLRGYWSGACPISRKEGKYCFLALLLVTSGCPTNLVAFAFLASKSRQVSQEEGQLLARQWECPFVECSAKDNENISASTVCSLIRLQFTHATPSPLLSITSVFSFSAAEVFTYLIKEIERDSGLLEVSGDSGCTIL